MRSREPMYAIYFNGLGTGQMRKREKLAMRYLAKHGIQVEHVRIDWRSSESFESILKRTVQRTKMALKQYDKVLLVGSSAGGSLVVNIMSRLHNQNLYGVTLCSRLHSAKLPWWDRRTLTRMAYIGTSKASRSFYDSVTYCGKKAIPELTNADKARLIIVRQWADDVVPRATMNIPGVENYKVPAFGHGWGIAMGVRRLPKIVTEKL